MSARHHIQFVTVKDRIDWQQVAGVFVFTFVFVATLWS